MIRTQAFPVLFQKVVFCVRILNPKRLSVMRCGMNRWFAREPRRRSGMFAGVQGSVAVGCAVLLLLVLLPVCAAAEAAVTLAPAIGTIATGLNSPNGTAVDALGNVYIADTANNVIRKVDGSGHVSIVAGGGTPASGIGDGGLATSASLNAPAGVAVDGAGNFYIADSGNNVVRAVTAQTGIINTVAGNGTPGYTGDQGPATSATLNHPMGIAVNSDHLYLSRPIPRQLQRRSIA
jgi:hypothetical protein